MAEWSGFFDAHKVGDSWDRTYLAEDFAKFFAPLIGNGIFAGKSNELQIFQSVPAGMSVVLSSGQSWIEGYGYVNDSDLLIPVDPADGALGRIDRIVNQWSSVDRRIRTVWKKGTPAVNPVAPPLQWDADYKELNICILDVSAGLSAITQDKIQDTRADSSVCGWVTGLIDQVDTSTLFAQWESAYEKEFTEQKGAWEEFFKDIQLDLGIPVPSPDKANHVLAVDSNGSYILSEVVNNFTTTEEGFVADARALKVLNDSKLAMELLWENGNTGSNFGSQTITTADVGHNFVLIECRVSTSSSTYTTSNLLPTNGRIHPIDYITNSGELNRRRVTPNTTSVYFQTAELSSSDDNSLMIPVKIYAVKGAIL